MDSNDRALTAFTMIGHAMFHTYELVIPIFVALWLNVFSVTAATLGLIVGAGFALIGVGALPSGILSDRYDSKRLIIGAMLGMGGGFVLLSIAPNVIVLALGLLLWGLAASVYHPAGLSLISRGAKERGTAFAYHGLAGNLGVAVGPFLGAILLAFFHWRVVALLLVVPALLAAAISWRIEFDETAGVDTSDKVTVSDGGAAGSTELLAQSKLLFAGGFAFVFTIAMLYGMYYRGVFTFLPDILAGVPLFEPVAFAGESFQPSQYVYAGLLMLGGVGQYAGGKLSDRITTEYALVGTFAVLVLISLAFVPAVNAGLVPLLVVCALLGFFVYMEAPINQAIIAKYVPSDVYGLSFGYTYLGTFGVGALGAAVAGAVLTYANTATLFAVLAIFAALAVGIGGYLIVRGVPS